MNAYAAEFLAALRENQAGGVYVSDNDGTITYHGSRTQVWSAADLLNALEHMDVEEAMPMCVATSSSGFRCRREKFHAGPHISDPYQASYMERWIDDPQF